MEKKKNEQENVYGISRSVIIERKKMDHRSLVKTLTDQGNKINKDDTDESEKETFEIGN
ncbi:unnamed protein product [Paramecium sonneborni]|uniref:Uncharacterized protein n=1 Tax=Paramecium sonneborni TaxID=65129 RepID=A0A8S1NXH9_9CILI|nr:unnamed protein product [Paramecium sonneborni]